MPPSAPDPSLPDAAAPTPQDAPPTVPTAGMQHVAESLAGYGSTGLARALARRWLQLHGPGSVPRLALASAALIGLTCWWTPAWLAAACALVALGVSVRAETALVRRLLPYTEAMTSVYGPERAGRLLLVAAGRADGPGLEKGLLRGLASTLQAARAAECSPVHVTGCRHHPVDAAALLTVPADLAEVLRWYAPLRP